MRAVEVTVHNFRSILHQSIALSPYGLLVGENNTGKSNAIDAIRVFYEKGLKYEKGRDFPKLKTEDAESWIEIEFKPTDEELAELKDEYRQQNGTFRVRKYFQSNEKDGEGKTRADIYAYVGGKLSDSRFYGFPNVGQGKFGDAIYVPAVSRLDDQTKLTGPSPLRDLISSVLKRVLSESSAYRSLKSSFEEFGGSIKTVQTDEGHSLDSIERDITAEMAAWGTSFRLTVNPVGLDDLIKNLIGHEIQDGALGQAQPASSYGQGFQRSLIFTLIRLAAKYGAPAPKPKKKDFSPSLTWLLFEEPEAFLHPNQIDILSHDLRRLAADDSAQVLLTTHSPQFASRSIEDLTGLARMRRTGCETQVGQIRQGDLNVILAQNQADLSSWKAAGLPVDDEDLTIGMESLKYILWLDPRRCGAFFAEQVLLVEGPTEVALINYMLETGSLARPQGSFFVLDTLGKFNMHRFMNLLGKLGIKHYVLCDDDNGRLAAVDKTIQDSRNTYTAGIASIPGCLETYLGVPRCSQPYRKPQHIMYHYVHGNISSEKIQSLGKIMNELLAL